MTRLHVRMWVEAPPERVFQMIESPPLPLLPPGGPRFMRLSGEVGQGARYRWEIRWLGVPFRADSTVVEYLLGERIIFEGTSGWAMRTEVTLNPEGRGTRLRFYMAYQFAAPMRWFISGRMVRLGIWHALRQVRAMIEQPPAAFTGWMPAGFCLPKGE